MTVQEVAVLKSSPSAALHPPERVLERRHETYWLADSTSEAELRLELSDYFNITEIWIQTSLYEVSPQFVTVEAVMGEYFG